MRFGDLTYKEIAEKAKSGWMVIVPTGYTEQQGLHLPVDLDTWFAETLCLARIFHTLRRETAEIAADQGLTKVRRVTTC